MAFVSSRNYIVIAPQIYISLDAQGSANTTQEAKPTQASIPMTWLQDGDNFRLDINLPVAGVLDILFPAQVTGLHVNGETIWENETIHAIRGTGIHAELSPEGLRLTCTSKGPTHILARVSTVGTDPEKPSNQVLS